MLGGEVLISLYSISNKLETEFKTAFDYLLQRIQQQIVLEKVILINPKTFSIQVRCFRDKHRNLVVYNKLHLLPKSNGQL